MKVIENARIYQCEYCGHKFLTKQGAKRHEKHFCNAPDKKKERIMNCKHDWETCYEDDGEPLYEWCTKCGATDQELDDMLNDDDVKEGK